MNSSDRNSRAPATISSRAGQFKFETKTNKQIICNILASSPYRNNNDGDDVGRPHQLVQRVLHEVALLTPQKQAAVGGVSGM